MQAIQTSTSAPHTSPSRSQTQFLHHSAHEQASSQSTANNQSLAGIFPLIDSYSHIPQYQGHYNDLMIYYFPPTPTSYEQPRFGQQLTSMGYTQPKYEPPPAYIGYSQLRFEPPSVSINYNQRRSDQTPAAQQRYEPAHQNYPRRPARMERNDLPSFWPQHVKVWFTTEESVFASKIIEDDEEKFRAVISKMEQEHLTAIEQLVNNQPTTDKYLAIKNTLINHYAMSRENSFRKLVSGLSLDGRRPLALYAEICKHADNAFEQHPLEHYG